MTTAEKLAVQSSGVYSLRTFLLYSECVAEPVEYRPGISTPAILLPVVNICSSRGETIFLFCLLLTLTERGACMFISGWRDL